jgi:hypothetical protein
MAWHEFIIVERLPACRIAYFESTYPSKDVTNEVEIGPLFPLFFASMQRTYAKENGQPGTEEAAKLWMGPARYHLPPTTRWICRLALANGQPGRGSVEVWMAVSERVVLGEYANVRNWAGGLYASVESGFDTTVAETWTGLQRLLVHYGLTAIGQEVLVENFQATNHGGWDRYRVMVEINGRRLDERGWRV